MSSQNRSFQPPLFDDPRLPELEASTPYFHNGLDYSDFAPKIREYYRKEHLEELLKTLPPKKGITGIEWHKAMLFELQGTPLQARYIAENHTDLSLQEAIRGAAKHIDSCKKQYDSRKKQKVYRQVDITPKKLKESIHEWVKPAVEFKSELLLYTALDTVNR